MPFIIATIQLFLPASHSLKEKRSLLAPVLTKLRKRNYSVIESGKQDAWQEAELAVALIANSSAILDREIEKLDSLLSNEFKDVKLCEIKIERYL